MRKVVILGLVLVVCGWSVRAEPQVSALNILSVGAGRSPWEGGWWVVGLLEARELWVDGGLVELRLDLEGERLTLRGPSADPLVLRGPGVELRAALSGDRADVRVHAGERRWSEVWRRTGPPALETEGLPTRLAPGRGFSARVHVEGSPQDLALVIRVDGAQARYSKWGEVAYYRELGRLPVGTHALTWPGLDRTFPERPLPAGRYRICLENTQVLTAPNTPWLERPLEVR